MIIDRLFRRKSTVFFFDKKTFFKIFLYLGQFSLSPGAKNFEYRVQSSKLNSTLY